MATSKAIMNKKKWLSLELNKGELIMLSTNKILVKDTNNTLP